jgi:predicted 3-demethylubiquinone-9 3-methyltransferase (glyoxalase superfamily)
MAQKIVPCLWYDHDGEEAARFYVTLLPDSRIEKVVRASADTPAGPEGYVMLVEFTLAGSATSRSTAAPCSNTARPSRS